ncbi:MAG: AAA family ATPase [Labilithrix sp.]|nr:AAA family ATPase [Labilithrix sp.]MBX3213879.1 AAA family ATPase [Labilithrix sp.]
MRVVLIPSGLSWIDAEIGGFPSAGVVAVVGEVGAGKTSLALGFALTSLARGPTCFLTNDSPEAVLEISSRLFEHDLRPHLTSGRLSILEFAPYFGNKVRSLASVDGPLAELERLVVERQVRHVVFDTFDPMFRWVDPASATATARSIMGTLQRWGVAVLCTMGGAASPLSEFARLSAGCLQLAQGELFVHHAGWCNVQGKGAPVQLVQGRGLVVRPSERGDLDAEREGDEPCSSLITDSMGALRMNQEEWQALWDDIAAPGSVTDASSDGGAPGAAADATRDEIVPDLGAREGEDAETGGARQVD